MKRNGSWIGICSPCFLAAIVVISGSGSATASREQVLYRFQGGTDGAQPLAGMTADAKGNLYGTTNLGGTGNCSSGCGTVFELSPPMQRGGQWTETVLYSFRGGDDGANPQAPLIEDKDGNLYGVTSQGGDGDCINEDLSGCGVAFELSPSPGAGWIETILYSFQGNPGGKGNGDLAWPNGLVFGKRGNLYGFAYDGGHCTTDETGTYCSGGAFKLRNEGGAWNEKVIYRFNGSSGSPAGAIFDAHGNLYGTAPGGVYGFGGVFVLQPPQPGTSRWTESSVYDFHGNGDGAFPLYGLVFDGVGNLYDVSLGTGSEPGNLFELMPAQGGGWTESVLVDFTGANGYEPTTGPIVATNGNLYGTTEAGGANGPGTVFALVPQNGGWTETVLHSFTGGTDGRAPYGGLVFGKGGALYGTTPAGGNAGCGSGCGIVFKVVP